MKRLTFLFSMMLTLCFVTQISAAPPDCDRYHITDGKLHIPDHVLAGAELRSDMINTIAVDLPDVTSHKAYPVIQAQGPGDVIDEIKEAESWQDLVNLQSVIMSTLILLGGWISAFIPGLKEIDSGVYRVLTWAIMVIAGFALIGGAEVWQGAIAYFFTTSLYEVVIKLFLPSPKPDPTA